MPLERMTKASSKRSHEPVCVDYFSAFSDRWESRGNGWQFLGWSANSEGVPAVHSPPTLPVYFIVLSVSPSEKDRLWAYLGITACL